MRRICAGLLAVCLLLGGCALTKPEDPGRYTCTYLDLFDTVTTLIGTGGSQEQFQHTARDIYERFRNYHQLFDIYHEYQGLANLKTVNDQAGLAPVTVDPAIIELLLACKDYHALTGGRVNVAMGSVLRLWHQAREQGLEDPQNAKLPDTKALSRAAEHMDLDSVIIDRDASTVYISDPEVSLDVGAIAKGWACQRVAENAPAGMLISVGGNVCATGPKSSEGTPWVVGIQDPEGGGYLHTIALTGGAVVTSGDYQRVYTVDGETYHHIIDPQTQMPSVYWRSVTVVCADSGMADALSTALFLLPLEEGQALAERSGVQVLWVDGKGTEFMTEGFRALLQDER